jgi:CHASE2 domain-containing sensor protein
VKAAAAADRARGDWLPGLHQAIASIFVIALCAFACGVIAIWRHERYRWLGLAPLLAGLCALIFFSRIFFQ